MNKTPISILQEAMAKEYCIPSYTITSCETESHQKSFTCRVQCKDLIASGTASTKKNAKQNAAGAMLKLLNIEPANSCNSNLSPAMGSPKVKDTESSSKCNVTSNEASSPAMSQTSFVNYIGKLQELCTQHRYPEPSYSEPIVSGPAHMRLFQIKCSVSTFEGDASGISKKQAKHLAAQKVYRLLLKQRKEEETLFQSDVTNVGSQLAQISILDSFSHASLAGKTITKFKQITKKVTKKKLIATCHMHLKNSYCNIISTGQLSNLKPVILSDHTKINQTVKKIEKLFGLTVEQMVLKTNRDNCIMYIFRIYNEMPILEIGMGTNLQDAKVTAMYNFIETLLYMMT